MKKCLKKIILLGCDGIYWELISKTEEEMILKAVKEMEYPYNDVLYGKTIREGYVNFDREIALGFSNRYWCIEFEAPMDNLLDLEEGEKDLIKISKYSTVGMKNMQPETEYGVAYLDDDGKIRVSSNTEYRVAYLDDGEIKISSNKEKFHIRQALKNKESIRDKIYNGKKGFYYPNYGRDRHQDRINKEHQEDIYQNQNINQFKDLECNYDYDWEI